MQGQRVYPDADDNFNLPERGQYGQWRGVWWCTVPGLPPDCAGNLSNHEVTEHEDGTITVSPSILVDAGSQGSWHGYLERGVWREC